MTSQTNRGWFGLFVVATLAALPLQVRAEATAQDLERLGKDLTPLGAERGANPDGSIPAWTGGLTALQEMVSEVFGDDVAIEVSIYSDAPAGANCDAQLFGGRDEYRNIIRDGVALVDGIRLMEVESSLAG